MTRSAPTGGAAKRTRVAAPPETVSLAIALLGLGVSIYLTVEHYAASKVLACPENSIVNCAKVTTSSYAEIGPLPVALLGAIYFAAVAGLCVPNAWRARRLDNVRIVAATTGVLSSLYFVWVELFRLDTICLWCTIVHLSTLALLGSVTWVVSGRHDAPVDVAALSRGRR